MIDESLLCSRVWRYYHRSKPDEFNYIRFLPGGRTGLYSHFNERGWRLERGTLCLLHENGEVTTRFTAIDREGTTIVLTGQHLPNPAITLCLATGDEWPILPGTRRTFATNIAQSGWEIGEHSYGVPTVLEEGHAKLRIGRYCSIGGGVTIVLANHRMDTVSTYPFIALSEYWPSAPRGTSDHAGKGDVSIGNDVWIGHNAFIAPGVSIADGAVIGAHAVISKNVPAYAVAAGNPARIVKYRFTEEVIAALLEIRWWDWPEAKVDRFLPLMMAGEIDAFLRAARQT